MKRIPTKRLQLNLSTVRTLQQPPQALDDAALQQVVGGLKSGSGAAACTKIPTQRE